MPYVHIEPDDVLPDLDTTDLAKELVRRDDWKKHLNEALFGDGHPDDGDRLMHRIFDNLSLGRPVEDDLRRLAWNQYGRSVP